MTGGRAQESARLCINLVTVSKEPLVLVGIQSFDRVKGTKPTKVMERIRVSLGAIFSITVSRCGAWAGPSGMTSRPPTLSCSISGGGTWSSAAVTIIASKGPHSGHPR